MTQSFGVFLYRVSGTSRLSDVTMDQVAFWALAKYGWICLDVIKKIVTYHAENYTVKCYGLLGGRHSTEEAFPSRVRFSRRLVSGRQIKRQWDRTKQKCYCLSKPDMGEKSFWFHEIQQKFRRKFREKISLRKLFSFLAKFFSHFRACLRPLKVPRAKLYAHACSKHGVNDA